MSADHSFPKAERLRRRREFIAVSETGRKQFGRHFIVISVPNNDNSTRIGITASRKVGSAVVRNRVKRLVRECYRQNKEWFVSADYSLIARPSAARLELAGVCQDLLKALQQLQAKHG